MGDTEPVKILLRRPVRNTGSGTLEPGSYELILQLYAGYPDQLNGGSDRADSPNALQHASDESLSFRRQVEH